jgi:hypothetical protein
LTSRNGKRDFVRRFLAARAFDHRDHAVEEGFARIGGYAHHEPVGQHARAAGHGRKIAARFANNRCGLAGYRRLIDRCNADDDFAVGRNEIALLDEIRVAFTEHRRIDFGHGGVTISARQFLRRRIALGCAQGVGLRLAAPFRNGFGKVRE